MTCLARHRVLAQGTQEDLNTWHLRLLSFGKTKINDAFLKLQDA